MENWDIIYNYFFIKFPKKISNFHITNLKFTLIIPAITLENKNTKQNENITTLIIFLLKTYKLENSS